jgi:hypothetical protein
LPRPPVKKHRKLAEAEETGRLNARLKHESKTWKNKKHMLVSIKNHLGKALDRIDPLEMVAVVGTTIVVKKVIDTTEDLKGKALAVRNVIMGTGQVLGASGIAQFIQAFGSPFSILSEFFVGLIVPIPPEQAQYEGMFPDWVDWLIAFAIAYIIVHHGELLLGLGQNLSVIIGMLLV